MTKMQPQANTLNAGPWAQFEAFERRIVTTDRKDVFIVAGGVFDAASPTIGPGIAVPRANFKIVVVVDPGQGAESVSETTAVYAVAMPNVATAVGAEWQQYATTVDDLEAQTGYDFL